MNEWGNCSETRTSFTLALSFSRAVDNKLSSFLFSVPRAPPRNVEAVFNATMAHICWEPPKVFPGEDFPEIHLPELN